MSSWSQRPREWIALALGVTLTACPAPPPPPAPPAALAEPPPTPTASAGVPSKLPSPAAVTTPEALARAVVDSLARRSFDDAFAAFNDTMRGALPAAKLREIWDGILAQAGPLSACGDALSEKAGALVAVVLPCRFEKASLDARVVVDVDGKVAGLFFKPAAAPYTLPSYAKVDTFEEREVTVNPGPWALPGVLTLPKAGRPAPAVILVHGSGPNDRDETVGANKPFKDIAVGLAALGVAVLRYDKRTRVHAKEMATSTDLTVNQETIDDAVAAASLLRGVPEIDAARIFVAGHSLGGELVPRVGQRDPKLAGLLILAGSARPLGPVMLEQMRYIFGLAGGVTPEQQKKLDEIEKAWARVAAIQGGAAFDPKETPLGAPPSYWLDLKGYDAPALAKTLRRPIFVAQGGRDYQVTTADFERWKAALAGRKGVTLKLYPALNHLFARGEGKSSPAEYQARAPVDEELIKDIAAWVKAHRAP